MAIRRAKQKEQVIAKLKELAPPNEQFVAVVHCETGPSPWLNGILDQIPLVGLIVAVMRKYYFFTVTSEHVVLNGANRFTNRPGAVIGSWPRNAFPVSNVVRGNVWSKMYVQFAPGAKPTRLNIYRYWRGEFDQMMAAVSVPADGSAPTAPPTAPPAAAVAPSAPPAAPPSEPPAAPPAKAAKAAKATKSAAKPKKSASA